MSLFTSLLLGILQGLTEFLPISSSSHLKLAKAFLHLPTDVWFDLVCHLGTLLALILFLLKEILSILTKKPNEILWFALALLPLFPMYFLGHSLFSWAANPHFLGFFWILTAVLLFIAVYYNPKSPTLSTKRKIQDVLWIGSMQSLALFPGISRMGSTLSGALQRGWTMQEATRFSFILAIPTVMGGIFMEGMKTESISHLISTQYMVAFFASFITGLFSVRWLFSFTEKRKLLPFAWYCLFMGLFSSLYMNFR